MNDREKKRWWLSEYEKLAHVLIAGTSDTAKIHSEPFPVAQFFRKCPGGRDSFWVNAHMYLDQGRSPEQAAAFWYVRVAEPLIREIKTPYEKKEEEEVTHGEA